MKKKQPSSAPHLCERGLIGLVGLGLMGRGIATCLIAHGFTVVAYDPQPGQGQRTRKHIQHALEQLRAHKNVPAASIRNWTQRLQIADSLEELAPCWLVVECIPENMEAKQRLYQALEAIVPARTLLASNTSSLPITLLQKGLRFPQRLLGMHWGEPAQILHYLEIIPGEQTTPSVVRTANRFAKACGKQPTQLKRDIRGFLSNRMMYAMLREACHLVESGIADMETVDRSFRNDIGWWATIAGPFRWMDLTGIPAYATVMEGLLPELSNSTEVPRLMQDMVKRKALGIQNQRGFYRYTRSSAKKWEERWVEFTYEIEKLATRYSAE